MDFNTNAEWIYFDDFETAGNSGSGSNACATYVSDWKYGWNMDKLIIQKYDITFLKWRYITKSIRKFKNSSPTKFSFGLDVYHSAIKYSIGWWYDAAKFKEGGIVFFYIWYCECL